MYGLSQAVISGVKTGGVGVDEFVELSSRGTVETSVGMEGTTGKRECRKRHSLTASLALRIKQYC